MPKKSENIAEVIDELKSENMQNTQAVKLMLNEINEKLEDIGDGKEFVFVRNTLSELKNSISERFSEFQKNIESLKDNDDNSSQIDIIELLSEKFKSVVEIFENDTASLMDKISALYDEFKLETGENFMSLKENLDSMAEVYSIDNLKISEISKNYENLSKDVISALLQNKNDLKTEIKEKSDKITETILSEFKSSSSQNKDDLKLEISSKSDEAKSALLDELKSIDLNLAKCVSANKNEITNDIEKYFLQYCSKITEITDIIVNLKNELSIASADYKSLLLHLEENIKSITDDINSVHSTLSDKVKNIFQQEYESLQNFISLNINALDENITTIGENLKTGFNALNIEMQNKFSHLFENLHENEKLLKKYNDFFAEFSAKLDILAKTDYSADFDSILAANEHTQELIKVLQAKLDELLKESSGNSENTRFVNMHISELNEKILSVADTLKTSKDNEIYALNQEIYDLNHQIEELLKDIDLGVKSIEVSDIIPKISELFERTENRLNFLLEEVKEKTSEDIGGLTNEISSQKNLLNELNAKLDIFATSNDTELLEDELLEIKEIILAQEEMLKGSNDSISEKTQNNFQQIISKIDDVTKTISAQESNAEKIKENIIETIVSVFNNTDFTEESEDIKDFVEKRTDDLNKQLHDVKSQLKTIRETDITDCSYTLNDVEQDIANLRGAIKDVTSATPVAEINQISRNIHNLTSSIDAISKNLTPAEIFQLKHGILKLNDDILSISSRTNKLLINSDETSKTISDGVEAFSHIAYNLEERIKEFSNRELVVQIADKVERVLMLAENSSTSDATVQKVLMFLGEWVDAISETFEDIDNKTDEISNISDALSELRKIVPEKGDLFEKLEEAFEEQQSRIDRLEDKINKLKEIVEMNGISPVLQRIEKLENIVETMNKNVEKLTSYVE